MKTGLGRLNTEDVEGSYLLSAISSDCLWFSKVTKIDLPLAGDNFSSLYLIIPKGVLSSSPNAWSVLRALPKRRMGKQSLCKLQESSQLKEEETACCGLGRARCWFGFVVVLPVPGRWDGAQPAALPRAPSTASVQPCGSALSAALLSPAAAAAAAFF